jgi:putative effector of murein hydrolase
VGASAALIWSGLGLVIFGTALLFTNKRKAIIVAALLLLAPLVVFVVGDLLEGWRYVGYYPYADFRSFISKFAPPATVILVQYVILRFALTRLMG